MSKVIDMLEAQVIELTPAAPANTYYDMARKEYLWPLASGGWIPLNETQCKRHLRADGYRTKPEEGEPISAVDKALIELQVRRGVDYAGPLAGHRAGHYRMQGKDILVTTSPVIPKPEPGEWPTIMALLDSLLFDVDHDQLGTFYAWVKTFLESLMHGPPRTGQALALCGPIGCGKSLLQVLLTILMGGRVSKPYQFALGESGFNADLFQAEHLCIEDEAPSTDMRARRTLGAFIKGVAANQVHRLHAKNRDAVTLEPLWRLTISCNDEPEHLLTLPPLDESILDKIIMLRCSRPETPFNDGTPTGRRDYWNRLVSEVPAFVHHLLGWQIPEHLACSRFGVKAFQHPALVEALLELSSERKCLSLIEMAVDLPWEGTAEELERLLREHSSTRYEAGQLLKWQAALGTFLGRLSKTDPERVMRMPREHGGRRQWTIRP